MLSCAGAHGRFELSCKQALQALRANSKPLQMLLESSLVDPLVDWNVEEDEKEQRHVLELATALQLFTMLLQNSKQSFQLSATASAEALDQMMSDFGSYTRLFRKVASAAHALKTATAELHSCQVSRQQHIAHLVSRAPSAGSVAQQSDLRSNKSSSLLPTRMQCSSYLRFPKDGSAALCT